MKYVTGLCVLLSVAHLTLGNFGNLGNVFGGLAKKMTESATAAISVFDPSQFTQFTDTMMQMAQGDDWMEMIQEKLEQGQEAMAMGTGIAQQQMGEMVGGLQALVDQGASQMDVRQYLEIVSGPVIMSANQMQQVISGGDWQKHLNTIQTQMENMVAQGSEMGQQAAEQALQTFMQLQEAGASQMEFLQVFDTMKQSMFQ